MLRRHVFGVLYEWVTAQTLAAGAMPKEVGPGVAWTHLTSGHCFKVLTHHAPLPVGRLSLQDTLVKIAKKLKKNNVAVDIISFGHEADNEEKLTAFHGAVNSNDNSHLVTVPPGPVLSDVLIGSPIFQVTQGAITGVSAHTSTCVGS
jgi:hypothetical protein